MTTIVNTPAASDNGGGAVGTIAVLVVILVMGILFFVYGLPILRRSMTSSAPQINVPDQIDVNINTTQ